MLKRAQRGFTLIELGIGLAIFGVLLAIGLPAFTTFLQNGRVKNASEGVLQGLNLARTEAIRRNAPMRFQFVSNLTATCALSSTSLAWVVSQTDPTGLCNIAPSDTVAPRIVQRQSATEGTRNIVIAAYQTPPPATPVTATTISFNGLGRVVGAAITQIDISNSDGVCQHVSSSGTIRCLRVLLTSGGQAKLCDPKVTAAGDPRLCS